MFHGSGRKIREVNGKYLSRQNSNISPARSLVDTPERSSTTPLSATTITTITTTTTAITSCRHQLERRSAHVRTCARARSRRTLSSSSSSRRRKRKGGKMWGMMVSLASPFYTRNTQDNSCGRILSAARGFTRRWRCRCHALTGLSARSAPRVSSPPPWCHDDALLTLVAL